MSEMQTGYDSVFHRDYLNLNVGFAAREDRFTPVMRNAERAQYLE